MDTENRIYQLATEIFSFDYYGYKAATGRVLLGVVINPEKREYEHLFGDFPDNFLTTINKKFSDMVAGYSVNVGSHFPELNINADVFLLNLNNLSDYGNEIDSLLIHELCHMILDSNNLDSTTITISEKDRYHGKKLHNKTDIENEGKTKHTIDYCNLLSSVCEIASTKYPGFQDRWDCINSAMRYDLKENLRQ
jgi:hypothetical protein